MESQNDKTGKLLNSDLDSIVKSGEKNSKKKKTLILIIIVLLVVIAVGIIVAPKLIEEITLSRQYAKGKTLFETGEYEGAAAAFTALGDYRDAAEMVTASEYALATSLYESESYTEAATAFERLGDYKDAGEMEQKSRYAHAMHLYEAGNYLDAIEAFKYVDDPDQRDETIKMARYDYANLLKNEGDYELALENFKECIEYKDTANILDVVAKDLIEQEDFETALSYLYLHSDDEENKKQVYYDYLVWQMQNYEYSNTAQTFRKIRDYKDVLTNDLFAGAQLLDIVYMSQLSDSYDTMRRNIYKLTNPSIMFTPEKLTYNFESTMPNFASVKWPIMIDESWNYHFEGRDIYYQNDAGQYVYGGTIGAISQPAEGETSGTVNLTLDLPGAMKIANTTFNYTLSS